MTADAVVRQQLLALLLGENAHMNFDNAVKDFPLERRNHRLPNLSYSPWHLLEHIRLSQWDILDFIRNPHYVAPPFPEGYWPPEGEAADPARWEGTLHDFHADLRALAGLVEDPATDLYTDLLHAPGYNILREILVIADHNAYHIGEFAFLRQVIDTWPVG